MEFKQFIEQVSEGVSEVLGKEVIVVPNSVKKNNGVSLEGVVISREDSNLAPTIYLNSFYEEYKSGKGLGDIVYEVVSCYEKSIIDRNIDMTFFKEYSNVAGRIFCKLVNYEWNKDLLESVPYKKFLDLAVVCYYSYENEAFSNGSILINNSYLENWEIGKEALFKTAMANTKELGGFEYQHMNEVIKDMMENDIREGMLQDMPDNLTEEEKRIKEEFIEMIVSSMREDVERKSQGIPMYILSNQSRIHGAICMIYMEILEEIGEALESDFYILPSSVHEVILVLTDDKEEKEKLKAMVNEVNVTQVEPEEVLSDSVYYYDREKRILSCCDYKETDNLQEL